MADDYLSLARPWGFDIAGAVLIEVDGGHFGSRVEPEERLFAWPGGADIEPRLAPARTRTGET